MSALWRRIGVSAGNTVFPRRPPLRGAASSAAFVAVLLMAAGTTAASQVVRGRVTEAGTNQPLASALVTLLDSAGLDVKGPAARSDTAGIFAIYAPPLGEYRIRVARIGYLPATSGTVRLGNSDIARVSVALSAAPQAVAPITIVEKRPLAIAELDGRDGFEFRRARGYGHYLVPADLVGMGSMNDIIGTGKLTGVRWLKVPFADMAAPRRETTCNGPGRLYTPGRPTCSPGTDGPGVWVPMMPGCTPTNPPLLILDTKRVDSWEELEGRVLMAFVAGIEVYRKNELPWASMGTAPIEFSLNSGVNRPCAVILVWTRGWFDAMEQSVKAATTRPQGPN